MVGTHPTACAEETLNYSSAVDAIAIGEYDCIIKDLADALEKGENIYTVRGLCLRSDNGYVRTAIMPPMKNLDDLPYAAKFIKEYLNEKDYFLLRQPILLYKYLRAVAALSAVIFVFIRKLCMDMLFGLVQLKMLSGNLNI